MFSSHLLSGPVDFLKTQLQLKRFPGFLDAAKTIWQKRGIAGYLQVRMKEKTGS